MDTLKRVTVRLRLEESAGLNSNTQIQNADDAVALLSSTMKSLDREMVVIINLDNSLHPLNFHVISVGGISNAFVPMESVFKSAILSNASSVMMLHNHPSGSTRVSTEDIDITERLCKAGEILNIRVVDHVIIAGTSGTHVSIREQKPDLFDNNTISGLMSAEEVRDPGALKKVMQRLQDGVQGIFKSDEYRAYLSTMAKFHRYSPNNCLLIHMQRPDSSGLVAGYSAWQKKFHRQVRKGEKGIQIIVPMSIKTKQQENNTDNTGQDIAEETEKILPHFGVGTVFDVSQTDGAPIPTLEPKELAGKVALYEDMIKILREISPVPIRFDNIPGSARGYYSSTAKEIVIQSGMPEAQTVKTTIHEISHSLVHDRDLMRTGGEKKDASTRETEAESIAYVVLSHLGIGIAPDEYSFPYIAGWAEGKEMTILQASLGTIQTVSDDLIRRIDEELQKIDRYEIYQIDASGDYRERLFHSHDEMVTGGTPITADAYERVYIARYHGESLDEIYEQYNINHPVDFRGHSLSISDVVTISVAGTTTAYYVDTFGFKVIPSFHSGREELATHKQQKTSTR